jgi:hypothetical protein
MLYSFSWNVPELNRRITPRNERYVTVCCGAKSAGTQSEQGSRFAERVLTVVATLRQQNRNSLAFLHAASEARLTQCTTVAVAGVGRHAQACSRCVTIHAAVPRRHAGT